MAGILNHQGSFYQIGPLSTEEFRNRLLDRNLPPPVNETLTQSGLVSKLQDIGNVINVPIFGNADENIPIHYDEEKRMFPLGTFYRTTQNVNLNRFIPQNDDYRTYELTIPPNLGYPTPEGFGDKNRGFYPTSYNIEQFRLVNTGDEKGVRFPFNVIDTYKSLNFQKESSLGLVGGQELEKTIIDKISQIQEEANVETPSTGNITPPIGNDGGVNSYVNRLRGSEQYFNTLPNGAVGWNEYNKNPGQSGDQEEGVEPTLGTEGRVNTLLERTSVSQVTFLFDLLGQNTYKPFYEDRRLQGTSEEGTNPKYYIGTEKNTNRGSLTPKTFDSSDFNGVTDTSGNSSRTDVNEEFFWRTGGESNFNEKTLLYKTQELVNNSETEVFINQTKKFFKDKKEDRLISRGNAISPNALIDAESNGNYCRVWTVNDRYNYLNAIRNTSLFYSPSPDQPGFSVTEGDSTLSVLMGNGIPKYHPVKEDSRTTLKKYMLSIENLAWADNLPDLPLSEIGPGDILSGNKGRIMWFPPYGLTFDENTSSNWTSTDFIGRSEPVYTYNNAKRSGQLSFKIIVDHPKVINGYRGNQNDAIERFFAGCVTPNDFLDLLDKNGDISQVTRDAINNKIKEVALQKKSNTYKVKKTTTVFYVEGSTTDTDGNPDFSELTKIANEIIADGGKLKISSTGFAGKYEDFPREGTKFLSEKEKSDDTKGAQKKQSKERAEDAFNKFINTLTGIKPSSYVKKIQGKGNTLSVGDNKNDRRVDIILENDATAGAEPKEQSLDGLSYYPEFAQLVDNLIIDESNYFDYIDANYPNYFSTISQKIQYFQPGYHSTTPEGLNTRLTFLNQCMRQGPSINSNQDKVQTQNLSFGRPPVCILRIGDFFHTKVVINSLSITYDESGIKWDLNPEGIGVQPMIANVQLSVDLIGGHSLVGPINRLQNAVSFNYYANTQMYDPRADKIDLSKGKIVDGVKLGELKKALLGEDGIDKLTESLKTEGITKQGMDGKNTGGSTDVNKDGDITIAIKGENNIVITSTGETKVIISIQNNSGFKDIINDTKPAEPDSKEYNLKTYLTSFEKNANELKDLKELNEKYKNNNQVLEGKISGGTSSNISDDLKTIKKNDKDIEKNDKKIKKLSEKNNKVKVISYLLDNESGSKKTKEFTYTENGLK